MQIVDLVFWVVLILEIEIFFLMSSAVSQTACKFCTKIDWYLELFMIAKFSFDDNTFCQMFWGDLCQIYCLNRKDFPNPSDRTNQMLPAKCSCSSFKIAVGPVSAFMVIHILFFTKMVLWCSIFSTG